MRTHIFIFILILQGCKPGNETIIKSEKLDEKLAKELVSLSVKCVDQ